MSERLKRKAARFEGGSGHQRRPPGAELGDLDPRDRTAV